MRVLFVSSSPLKREVGVGNTFLNIFDSFEDVEFASICTRNGNPEPPISKCFCITEKDILKNLLLKEPAGKMVDVKQSNWQSLLCRDGKVITFVKQTRWTIFFWMQNMVWKLGSWKSKELENFILDFRPDIIFTSLTNAVYLNNLILHVHEVSQAKLAVYVWDDYYSMKRFMLSPLRWIKHLIDRVYMRQVVQRADIFYVISHMQKMEYEKSLKIPCKILTKGADFIELPKPKVQYNDPIQIIFTGNIGLNRWKSLHMIADVLERINQDGIKAQLRIYTATPLTHKMKKALNREESSFLMGSIPSCAVPEIQRNADMLVHVEALDLGSRLRVRHSFSTKIVDYLKAARPILAVGPRNVASIDHLERNNCAIIADNKVELEQKLRSFLDSPEKMDKIIQNAYACGLKYHNKHDIQKMLQRDLEEICRKK